MATLNYVTLKVPKILFEFTSLVQETPHFNVYRYKEQKGVIFRMPRGIKEGDVCHFFIEHEINLSNTLKTGTLTMKVQVTLVPCHMGLFSGFDHLEGSYNTSWMDEEDWGYESWTPDYDSKHNVKKIVPLPVNIKTNLYEYLNEILFEQQDDANILNDYAVNLGCKKKVIQDAVFIPAPELTSETMPSNSRKAHKETTYLFETIENNGQMKLIP